jgi:hypothetical protein
MIAWEDDQPKPLIDEKGGCPEGDHQSLLRGYESGVHGESGDVIRLEVVQQEPDRVNPDTVLRHDHLMAGRRLYLFCHE